VTYVVKLITICFVSRDALKEQLKAQRQGPKVSIGHNHDPDVEVSRVTFSILSVVLVSFFLE